ncbi:MAG: hypothetical protein Ta2D_02180 [Rickettsiales bacterium]|nr:MAG: hypothetical protein Ta2D_02180 [Rickettsiales bacterium]
MDISINMVISILSSSIAISVITAALSYYFSKRLEFKKMYREQKFREEMWKKDEESNRREFLVSWIKDETIPMSTRIEAAREYLEKGYNGSVKNYIYQKGLFDNSKK